MNRIIFISIGFAALAAAAAVAIVASAGGARASAHATGVAWVPCRGVAPTAAAGTRCGSIRVPLDRTNARLGTTKIVFALVPRRDASRPSLGTLVLSSGPILAAAAEYTAGLDPVRSRRDVLFVDQRGTGRSGVLACPVLRGVVPALLSEQQMVSRIGACGTPARVEGRALRHRRRGRRHRGGAGGARPGAARSLGLLLRHLPDDGLRGAPSRPRPVRSSCTAPIRSTSTPGRSTGSRQRGGRSGSSAHAPATVAETPSCETSPSSPRACAPTRSRSPPRPVRGA